MITHGLAADEVDRLSAHERGPSSTPALVWCPLRSGEETLAWLAIYGLAYGKRSLDAFDIELIDAIGPFVAAAFEEDPNHRRHGNGAPRFDPEDEDAMRDAAPSEHETSDPLNELAETLVSLRLSLRS